uniref:PPAR_1 n=1 Tax=Sinonovacula constricta TaxID=98310 RepID=A0A6B9DRA3_SINCO|nr:PPAR_1 [Sinonovacula constricta]QPO24037.1 peroxisomal proliferator-activated receptor [Sinonovacula constricta]
MQRSASNEVFSTPTLKRCQSSAQDRKCDQFGSDVTKKMRFNQSDLPNELITLSYNLLNQIHKHEQKDSVADSGISDSSSREDPADSVSRSMTADSSSSFNYNDFNSDAFSEITGDASNLSPISVDSTSYGEYSPCDSVMECSSRSKKALSISSAKPLYTAELQVLCRICGDRASGFHYGVHSCEGCKGFFRRTLKKDLVYKPCRENSQCRIDTGTRNKCQYCRYKKCLNAGMSQNAVRFGRMPKAEREKLVADKEELSTTCSTRIMELRTLSDTIKGAFTDCFSRCKFVTFLQSGDANVKQQVVKVEPNFRFMADSISQNTFEEADVFGSFQEAVVPIVEGMVKFTKRIPNLSQLSMHDRITLLKQNCFTATLILTHLMLNEDTFYMEGESLISVTDRQGHFQCQEAQSLFSGIFRIARRLLPMHLKKVEVSLFCAAVLLMESPEMSSHREIEKLQEELLNALRLEVKHNHPKDKFLFPRLLVHIADLIQLSEEFRFNLNSHLFDKTPTFAKTHELLCEIFDLR